MAPIVLLRLFRTDCDFNQATPHPADPIKCRTSTQRTQAPESVDAGRASRLDPLENRIGRFGEFAEWWRNDRSLRIPAEDPASLRVRLRPSGRRSNRASG
jgi:hypothetical protein